MDYFYVQSRGAHTVHSENAYDLMLGSHREVWIASDGSGVIRERRGPMTFYTDRGGAGWRAAGAPDLTHGPRTEVFAQGILSRGRFDIARSTPAGLRQVLQEWGGITLSTVAALLGEAIAPHELRHTLYQLAQQHPGVETMSEIADDLDRTGKGLAARERGYRIELIFADATYELLGKRKILMDPGRTYAPVGTLVSWTAYIERALVESVPPASG